MSNPVKKKEEGDQKETSLTTGTSQLRLGLKVTCTTGRRREVHSEQIRGGLSSSRQGQDAQTKSKDMPGEKEKSKRKQRWGLTRAKELITKGKPNAEIMRCEVNR